MSAKNTKKSRKKLSKVTRPSWKSKLPDWRIVLAILLATVAAGGLYHLQSTYKPADLSPPPASALYKQADQPIDRRVENLLAYMTLEEKLGQMAMVDKNSIKKPIDIARYNIGAVLSGAGAKPAENTPAGWKNMVETLKIQAKQSRLEIPLLYGVDATHGHANVPGATVFPHAIGLGASRNPTLVRDVAKATAEEAAATGINWNFAPALDAPEDIRWGRTYESFSSDPQLNAQLGAAYVEGTQNFVLASAKHFIAAGSMQWLSSSNKDFKIDQGKTAKQDDLLDSEYLVPFAAAVRSDVGSVMVGLNHWGEKRVIDDKYLLTDKLKNQLGFKGFVVSDWYGVYEFSDKSNYRANVDSINAGLDMSMLPFDYKNFIRDVRRAVKKGDIPESRINDAVRRILYQKFEAGLFDDTAPKASIDKLGSSEHRALARRAVAESAVLLKNKNNTLPLAKNSGHILVAGSGADNIGRQSGAWTVEWQGIDGNWLPGATSILQGIKKTVGQHSQIDYKKDGNFEGMLNQRLKADVGIVVISEKPYAEGWGDSDQLTLEANDAMAIERLRIMVEKLIVVTVTGRPIFMEPQMAKSDAVVAAWLPGSEGAGLADVLFGDQPFKGKLPVAWPTHIDQLPVTTRGTTTNGQPPLFSRGSGL